MMAASPMNESMIEVRRGDVPLIVSFPHTGTEIPADITGGFLSPARALRDTDWHIHELYGFVHGLGATTVRTPWSRSVIDVNRDPSGASLYPGQATTELCPLVTFDGEPLYRPGAEPDGAEVARRRAAYFDPFHASLAAEVERLLSRHGRVVLYDAHSIRSVVPRLFEGRLPQFNIGTYGGRSCAPELTAAIERACAAGPFDQVTNGRFKGGHITRRHGAPERGVHAVQMELAIRGYLDEPAGDEPPPAFDPARAAALTDCLRGALAACLAFATA
ncbi:N-formylglutamate deformylase [Azospirillum sp. SYSU D00513]|uniref:N-formylglutamate deformylase n=1 Tax=Azospirillum sp. SYSU D00513 TaxID=2812561 RepID=UPI001FFE5E65|nr:N-formylglutamate deformylase [Azospirillum sp. SYSU D00513]